MRRRRKRLRPKHLQNHCPVMNSVPTGSPQRDKGGSGRKKKSSGSFVWSRLLRSILKQTGSVRRQEGFCGQVRRPFPSMRRKGRKRQRYGGRRWSWPDLTARKRCNRHYIRQEKAIQRHSSGSRPKEHS